jgi:hypothetical protein
VLPADWPPRRQALTREPMRVPYLESPPDVHPIDVGRQLFVDDFLIAETTLERTTHRATFHPDNPVLTYDRAWEREDPAPFAAVFSDGVWYDPADELFKMWYCGGYLSTTCYATSVDGVHWDKPLVGSGGQTNVVMRHRRDSSTIWLDHTDRDPARRFKMFTTARQDGWHLALHGSADGIHWSEPLAISPRIGDRTTVFYNPFRGMWVYSLRTSQPGTGRSREYREHPDPVAGLHWTEEDKVLWVGADRLDPHHPRFPEIEPQLYNLDAVAYESLMLGLFSVHQGPPNQECDRLKIHKRNEVLLGYSRDGFHWHRPDRRPFLGVTEREGDWNWGNMQSAGGCCLVVGDSLHFYVSGRRRRDQFWDGWASTGLGTLRRDGFASMDAGRAGGTLTTRPVQFAGRHLFVNAQVGQGELRVEVLDGRGEAIEPFTVQNCVPLRADETQQAVHWAGATDLSALAGSPVRFRFHLQSGSLYAFWVSPDERGASGGYVSAGGPGFSGPRDTVGQGAYQAVRK